MIKLKSKIVKSDFINESRLHAIQFYKSTWMDSLRADSFMDGVKYTIDQLKETKLESEQEEQK